MYRSIVVPLDGSAFGEHALPVALSIARRSEASLTLLHVHAPLKAVYLEGAAFLDESLENDLRAQQRGYLEVAAERMQAALGRPVSVRLIDGEIATAIAADAAKHGADLVVMTTHGRGAMGRFWLGSTADELVRQLPMPVLLVRPTEGQADLLHEPVYKRILIPLDGTALAEQIIPRATALGELMGAEYTLMRVIKPVLPLQPPTEMTAAAQAVQSILARVEKVQQQLQDEAKQYLDKKAAELRARGLTVHTRVDAEEQPAVAILKDAAPSETDLVALETHGRRGLARLFVGSVADKVLRGAAVPVLLHKPG